MLATLNLFLSATEIHFRVQTSEIFLPSFSKIGLVLLYLSWLFFPWNNHPHTLTTWRAVRGLLLAQWMFFHVSSNPRHSMVLWFSLLWLQHSDLAIVNTFDSNETEKSSPRMGFTGCKGLGWLRGWKTGNKSVNHLKHSVLNPKPVLPLDFCVFLFLTIYLSAASLPCSWKQRIKWWQEQDLRSWLRRVLCISKVQLVRNNYLVSMYIPAPG